MAAAHAKIVLLEKFEERKFLQTIQDYRCNVLFIVPPLMVFLSKNELVDKFDLSSLRMVLSGAAPLSKEVEDRVRSRLNNPNLVLKQGYGMSETTVGVTSQKDIVKPGSVGELNEGLYAKVIDEAGIALGPYERGQLCFKGSVIMMGYINDKASTAATMDEEGWQLTFHFKSSFKSDFQVGCTPETLVTMTMICNFSSLIESRS